MSLTYARADASSFRDPSGRVYRTDKGILRTVSSVGAAAFDAVWQSGILQEMEQQGRLVSSEIIPPSDPLYQEFGEDTAYLLKHSTLPLITYPYEWSFAALKSAALAHLDLQLALLGEGFVLSDASAFNMQFIGAQPLHIDVLSVIPYQEGMCWGGYRQFLNQFLNPLVLESKTGVSFAPFFRAALNGISSEDVYRLLPWSKYLSPGLLLHVVTPAWGKDYQGDKAAIVAPVLPKGRYRGLLQHLRTIISALQPPRRKTAWGAYSSATSYADTDAQSKRQLVRSFMQLHRPAWLLDIGCNAGEYACLALEAGAQQVVGIDSDRAAVDAAFTKSAADKLNFTPLVVDVANASPAQGWNNAERSAFAARVQPDAVMALALIHHLCIAQNIPLPMVIEMLVSYAPRGLIEFIPKSDPKVQELLRLRPDIFPGYSYDAMKSCLSQYARIVAEQPVGASGRVLFQFERNPA